MRSEVVRIIHAFEPAANVVGVVHRLQEVRAVGGVKFFPYDLPQLIILKFGKNFSVLEAVGDDEICAETVRVSVSSGQADFLSCGAEGTGSQSSPTP